MNNNKWICYDPVFECEQYNPELLIHSPWVGHRNFAYDYVCFERPSVIVELGSYYGCSAFAFLQAIKDHVPETSFYAVDTWQGDDFTKNDYTEDIYHAYKQINDRCFSGLRSHMVRKTFDEACAEFADKSIDLLHIDGSHKYEDVRNDYLRWRRKVADDGVIFFHDVGEDLLFGEPMGSHIFWNELKAEHPFTAEFAFSNGLGILFLTEEKYRQFREMVPVEYYQKRINLQDTINKDTIRKYSFTIRDLQIHNKSLQEQVSIMDHHLGKYRVDTAAAANYIKTLESDVAEKDARILSLDQRCSEYETAAEEMRRHISGLEADKEKLSSFASDKERYAAELESQMGQLRIFAAHKESYEKELQSQMAQLQTFASDKERYAAELENQMCELRSFASDKERYAAALEEQMTAVRSFATDKEHYAAELENQMCELRSFATDKEHYAAELENQMCELRSFATDKERYAAELEGQMSELRSFAADKERYAAELEGQMAELRSFASGKENYAADLERQMDELRLFASGKERYIDELLTQMADLNRYAEGKTERAASLEGDLESLRLYAQQKEQQIADLQLYSSNLNESLEAARKQIEALEAEMAKQIEQKNAQLREAAKQYGILSGKLEALCEKVRKIPFGKRLVAQVLEREEGG